MDIKEQIHEIEKALHWNAPHEPSNSTTRKLLEIIKLQQRMIEDLQQETKSCCGVN